MNSDTEQRPFDVFISYASENKLEADAILAKLEENGVRCWIAWRDLVPGTQWQGGIIRALEQSRIMVLVFSDHANKSPQVWREVERAVDKGLAILPFRLEDTPYGESLELGLSGTHWMDALDPPLEKHINELKDVVRRLLDSPGAIETYARKSRPPTRRLGVVAWMAIVAVMAMLGWGAYHVTRPAPIPEKPPTPKQTAIEAKLESIQLETVIFDGLPLSEIVHNLNEQSIKRDPEHKGVNFTLSSDFDSDAFEASKLESSQLDLTKVWGSKGAEAVDVKISLSNVSMANVLQAICNGASYPIDYAIEDYGVVFFPVIAENKSNNLSWIAPSIGGVVVIGLFFVNRKTGWPIKRFRKKPSGATS